MATALNDIHDLAENPAMVRRATASAVFAAVQIGSENYDGSQYEIMRRALSQAVLNAPTTWGPLFSWAVAANPVITLDSSDGDLQFTVNSVWDAIAGAFQSTSTATPTDSATDPASGAGATDSSTPSS